jgi:UDP-N-acetylglucosamine--N-acetylmuramyl-(pentapeptide) pyrophosphoryl-undecaprenol N-acetylglucosamine transferase
MASLLNKPLVLVNADASLLLSTRSLLPVADAVAFGFDGPAVAKTRHAFVTGNPVRAEIENLPAPAERFRDRSGPLSLLVVGGSLGAKVLNEIVPAALSRIDPARRPRVVHQSGVAHEDVVRATYATLRVQAEVLPFIDDMPAQLAACDVIVCRAGAVTVSELCAAGVASVLVPLIVSTTAHQRDNANYMAERGAARHLPQTELSAEALAQLLGELDRDGLRAMAERAHALARPQAAARVADAIEKLVPAGGRA